ncbi:MAG TPA: DUF6220 domain-containing protein [Patescibacteria group bacterium]|nr:DUF6220 domain-containing protein [Patescibacteria group bacterium]
MAGDDLAPLAQRAFVIVAWVLVGCLVVQFFLVGLDVFEAIGESELHRDFAYVYGWLTPILVLLAMAAGLPRRVLLPTIALLALYAIQTYLPTIAEELPRVAALHAVNALLVFWLAVRVARSVAWIPDGVGTVGR